MSKHFWNVTSLAIVYETICALRLHLRYIIIFNFQLFLGSLNSSQLYFQKCCKRETDTKSLGYYNHAKLPSYMLPLSACYLTPHTHIFNKREGNRNREFIFAKTVTAKKILKLSLSHTYTVKHTYAK